MFIEHYDYMMNELVETFLRTIQKTSIKKLIQICSEEPQPETSETPESDESDETDEASTQNVPDVTYYYPDALRIREICLKLHLQE